MERNPDNEIAQIEQSLEEFLEREMGDFPENQPISGWQDEADRPYDEEIQQRHKPQADRRELQADMLPSRCQRNVYSEARGASSEGRAGEGVAYRRETADRYGGESRSAPPRRSPSEDMPDQNHSSRRSPSGARPGQDVSRRLESGATRSAATRQRQPDRPVDAARSAATRQRQSDRPVDAGSGRSRGRQEAQEGSVRKRPAAGSRPVREEEDPSEERKRPSKSSVKRKTPQKSNIRTRREREDRYEEDYEEDDDYDGGDDGYEEEPDDDDRRNVPARRKKKKRRKSRLKRLLIFLLLICLLIGGLWYYAVGRIYTKMTYHEIESLVNEPMKEDGVINILLIGNDSREAGEDGRSDAMILLSISSRTKTIHMMSLLRDMYVDIPGRQGNRLNAAYAFGGPELLMETLEQNLDLEVNRYVLVNFQAFANLVDAVGGVDLELTNDEVQYVNGYLTEYNNLEGRPEGTDYLDFGLSGMIHLNGPQALAYCRIRYIGSDFGRTERQRKVLAGVLHQAPKAVLTNPVGLINGLLPNLTTNLTEAECRELSLQALSLLRYDIVQSSIPIQGSYSNASIRGMSVLDVDFEANKAFIRQNIYGE